MNKNIELFFIPFELGAGTRGASLGPEAIRIAGFDSLSNFFSQHSITYIQADNKELFEPIKHNKLKRIEHITEFNKKVKTSIKESIKKRNIPVVVSGDHSVATGVIAGIREAKKKQRLAIIWIDAHTDLHSPYTTPSGNVHGMTLASVMQKDNFHHKINTLNKKEKTLWHDFKNLQPNIQNIYPEDIIFIAARDIEKEEKALMKKLNMMHISVPNLRSKGIEKTLKMISKKITDCTDIYLSFDVDCLDPSISKGTGTPVKNGLKRKEADEIVKKILQDTRVCCFEITEVNPTLDRENAMAETAFNILRKGVNSILMN